jgi:medium-chain acyl-[acyl-carrier-protein] hydrolase
VIAAARDRWISIPEPRPSARLRLFCFVYAGGGASAYFPWSRRLREPIEVCAVQPPGRENRLREAPFTELQPFVADLASAIAPYIADKPFAFFGHSMGALIAYELTRTLREQGAPLPARIFASGALAPHLPSEETPLHPIADDTAFIEAVASRYGAVPKIVMENEELRSLILPALRADMGIIESYQYREAPPLPIDITAYGGVGDRSVRRDRLEQWAEHTTGEFSCLQFAGDHFFLNDARDALLSDVSARLSRHL